MDPGSIPENWRKAENGRPHFELEGGRVFIHERGCLRTTSKTLTNCKKRATASGRCGRSLPCLLVRQEDNR